MLAFAKSTLGELKDSLLEPDDSDDESPTSSPCEAVPATSTAFSAAAWPPGWSAKALESYSQTAMTYAAAAEPVCQLQGPKVGAAISGAAAATTANAPQLGLVENGITSEPSLLLQGGDSEHAAARETDASMGAEGAQPETEADVSACSLHTELGGPVAAIDPPELPATSSEIRTEPSAATDAFDSAETDEQKPVSSLTEKYSTLLTQHNALQQRFREMSDMQSQMDVLVQQVEAWRCAHSVAQSRVEALTLENSDLKEKALTRAMDSDERRLLLQRLQEREAEVKAASDALTQLRQVFEDGAGEDEARCARLEAELRVAQQTSAKAQAALAVANADASEARAAAEVARASVDAIKAEHQGRFADQTGTAEALEVLLREKEQYLEEKPHLVDKRLVTCMLANYMDHFEHGQRALADAVLEQMLQIFGGLPDLEARQRIRSMSAKKEELSTAFLEFLDQETSEGNFVDGTATPTT